MGYEFQAVWRGDFYEEATFMRRHVELMLPYTIHVFTMNIMLLPQCTFSKWIELSFWMNIINVMNITELAIHCFCCLFLNGKQVFEKSLIHQQCLHPHRLNYCGKVFLHGLRGVMAKHSKAYVHACSKSKCHVLGNEELAKPWNGIEHFISLFFIMFQRHLLFHLIGSKAALYTCS